MEHFLKTSWVSKTPADARSESRTYGSAIHPQEDVELWIHLLKSCRPPGRVSWDARAWVTLGGSQHLRRPGLQPKKAVWRQREEFKAERRWVGELPGDEGQPWDSDKEASCTSRRASSCTTLRAPGANVAVTRINCEPSALGWFLLFGFWWCGWTTQRWSNLVLPRFSL